jgi:predicted TIM-barrel fold metal-dependent hydrolase
MPDPALLADLPLVDHHCHGVARDALDRAGFEALLCEADGPGRWHGSLFDSQVGLAVRRVCAPLLDLPVHSPAEHYLARRAELGPEEVNRRLVTSTGITDFLVDTGYLGATVTSPEELGRLAGARARRIVRLEAVAEQAVTTTTATGFAEAYRVALAEAAAGAAGLKSIAAYRVGLDLDPSRPGPREVADAAGRWQARLEAGAPLRMVDEVLTRFAFWTGVDLGLPVQFHVGYGDADIDLHRCDPLLLTPLLRATAGAGVPVMLLHNYPFHRHAGYLAQVFDHVFVDIGLTVQGVGTRAREVLEELFELAPFGAVLFSTDAFGLAELYAVSTSLFRDALGGLLDDGVAAGAWSTDDARRIARLVCAENAHRAYGLDGA